MLIFIILKRIPNIRSFQFLRENQTLQTHLIRFFNNKRIKQQLPCTGPHLSNKKFQHFDPKWDISGQTPQNRANNYNLFISLWGDYFKSSTLLLQGVFWHRGVHLQPIRLPLCLRTKCPFWSCNNCWRSPRGTSSKGSRLPKGVIFGRIYLRGNYLENGGDFSRVFLVGKNLGLREDFGDFSREFIGIFFNKCFIW